jgi:hypothetical protein
MPIADGTAVVSIQTGGPVPANAYETLGDVVALLRMALGDAPTDAELVEDGE